jgi:hypothetical protein
MVLRTEKMLLLLSAEWSVMKQVGFRLLRYNLEIFLEFSYMGYTTKKQELVCRFIIWLLRFELELGRGKFKSTKRGRYNLLKQMK